MYREMVMMLQNKCKHYDASLFVVTVVILGCFGNTLIRSAKEPGYSGNCSAGYSSNPTVPNSCYPGKKFNGVNIRALFVEYFASDPISTERHVYELLRDHPLACNCNYLAVPWVYLIKYKKLHELSFAEFAGGCTVCQHVEFEKIIPILKKMNIQVLFTPHVCKGKRYDGITVLPFPHYAINGVEPALIKDIRYSFIGCDTHSTRRTIFNLPNENDVCIKQRSSWHFFQVKKSRP